jgi:hypothetical protein
VSSALAIIEYSTGLSEQPRSGATPAHVPGRQAAVVGLVALIAGTTNLIRGIRHRPDNLNQQHIGDSLADPGVARAVLGGRLYVAVIAVARLGAVTHTAGTTVALVGLVFLMPP